VNASTHEYGGLSDEAEKVLLIARDAPMRFQLRRTLEAMKFDVQETSDGGGAIIRLRMEACEVILMECATFGAENVMACGQLRCLYPRLPILVTSSLDSLDHKVVALEAGADDFLVHPLHERELAARLRSAVRRFRAPAMGAAERLVVGEIILDLAGHRVEKSGEEVSLAPSEFRLLEILMQQPGRVVSHTFLAGMFWGRETAANRKHLRVIMRGLRRKIEEDPSHPKYLVTHAHFGYRFQIQ